MKGELGIKKDTQQRINFKVIASVRGKFCFHQWSNAGYALHSRGQYTHSGGV